MYVTLEHLGGSPAFVLRTDQKGGWDRPFGAMQRPDGWVYPAYYPFGHWAAFDLRRVDSGLVFDRLASQQLSALAEQHAEMEKAEAAAAAKQFVEIPVPAGFKFHLPPFKHQSYGITRALYRWRDLFLWEMGTGKTKTMVETFRVLKATNQFRRALVIAPPVVLPTWEREVRVHSDGELRSMPWIPTTKIPRAALMEASRFQDVILMTYSRARIEIIDYAAKAWTLSNLDKANAQRKQHGKNPFTAEEVLRMQEFIETNVMDLDFDTIVADESHTLGNFESDQTKSALRLSTKAVRRYELTGTAGDRPDRLYPQLRFLSPALMAMSYPKFCEKFLRTHPEKRYLVMGFRNLNVINQLVDTIATRAKKSECLDLPPVTIQDVIVDPGPRQIARYNELAAEMRASLEVDFRYFLDPDSFRDTEAQSRAVLHLPHGATRVVKLLQVASGYLKIGPDMSICDPCPHQEACVVAAIKPYTLRCKVVQEKPETVILRDFENPKLETFEYYLEKILDDDPSHKVIVWANGLPELDDLEIVCKKLKVGYVRVDGSNTHRIKSIEAEFQETPDCRVYLGQVSSGVGITLTAANYMIYYSLPWDSRKYLQAMDRNNRYGQTRAMTVYRMMTRGTLDQFVATVLEQKGLVAYTLTEKITCAPCVHQLRCATEMVRPFRTGCIYEPNPQRPIASVELVRERRS